MKNKYVFIVLAVLLIGLTFFSNSGKKTVRPRNLGKSEYEKMLAWTEANYQNPEEYLLGLYAEKDIVLLGTDHIIADGINFLAELVPSLQASGINTIAVDFLLDRDQAEIDRLLTAEAADGFDEKLAKKLLFNRIIIFGYQEYVDMLYSVWQVNSTLPESQEKIRVLGLAPFQDFSIIQTKDDFQNNELMLNVIQGKNTVDSALGRAAVQKLSSPGQKSLVFSELPHAFSKFFQKGFEKRALDLGYPQENTKRMGNYIYEAVGDRVATVLIHTFFPDRQSPATQNYPLGGIIEKVARGMDNLNKRFAFRVEGSVFADLEILGEYVSGYSEKVSFSDFTDGYIFLNPITRTSLVTPIQGFINAENIGAARKNFPGPKESDWDANQLNGYINSVLTRHNEIKKFFIL
jgi:hypothetical protein